MKLAFLACIEPGVLEEQGLLLFRSIRRFAGRHRDAPCRAYSPRPGRALRAETRDALAALGVEHVTEPLNREFDHYPIANKVLASAHAEATCDADVVVFLDSDTIVTGEPAALELPPGTAAAVRPVNRQGQGSTGPGDVRDDYWRALLELLDAPQEAFVTTTVDRRRVRAYFNAGLIACRREERLFARWERDFRRLHESGHHPRNGLNNLDQLALAATLARVFERVRIPDLAYNYPLPKRAKLGEPWRSRPLDALVHVHYFSWFQQEGFLERLAPPLDLDSPVTSWLRPQLPLHPLIPRDARPPDE